MSPKEQHQAVQLLREWLEAEKKKQLPPEFYTAAERERLARTEAFLRLEPPSPESHGQRRS